jgi:hypothetical protein
MDQSLTHIKNKILTRHLPGWNVKTDLPVAAREGVQPLWQQECVMRQ